MIKKGRTSNKIIDNFQLINKLIWNESIYKALIDRNLQIVNDLSMEFQITASKTIMSYITEYIKNNKLQKEVYDYINYVRLFKKAIIPVELVSDRGGQITDYFNDIKIESLIEQILEFH